METSLHYKFIYVTRIEKVIPHSTLNKLFDLIITVCYFLHGLEWLSESSLFTCRTDQRCVWYVRVRRGIKKWTHEFVFILIFFSKFWKLVRSLPLFFSLLFPVKTLSLLKNLTSKPIVRILNQSKRQSIASIEIGGIYFLWKGYLNR